MPVLNNLLKKFYIEARRKDKQPYSKSSLTAIRFGLCCFIKSSRPDVDIINGSEFNEVNHVFKAKVVEFKKIKVEHKPAIAKEDLKKLYQSVAFDTATSTGLQNKVWFEIMLFFCRCGQENLRASDGFFWIWYRSIWQEICFSTEVTKNRRQDKEAEEGGFMFERPGDILCPVQLIEYIYIYAES